MSKNETQIGGAFEILLAASNPLDLRPENLKGLAEEIAAATGISAGVKDVPPPRYGVTWWEVLTIYVGGKAADALVGQLMENLLAQITERVKAWYVLRRQEKGNSRPLSLTFRDENGEIIQIVKMKPPNEASEVEVTVERPDDP